MAYYYIWITPLLNVKMFIFNDAEYCYNQPLRSFLRPSLNITSQITSMFVFFRLFSSCLDADLQRGDGVYSRFLPAGLAGPVTVTITDRRGAAFAVKPGPPTIGQPRDSPLPVCCGSAVRVPEERRQYLGVFLRNHSLTIPPRPGATASGAVDRTPPAKIGDLSVEKTTADDGDRLTLSWTAVGGDLADGQTDAYRVFFSDDMPALVIDATDDTSADFIEFNQYDMAGRAVNYSLDPGPRAGSVYIAIKAGDRFDNWGRMSNLVRVQLGGNGAAAGGSGGESGSAAQTGGVGGDWTLIGIILGVILILVISLFVLVISIVCGKRGKQVKYTLLQSLTHSLTEDLMMLSILRTEKFGKFCL